MTALARPRDVTVVVIRCRERPCGGDYRVVYVRGCLGPWLKSCDTCRRMVQPGQRAHNEVSDG